MLLKAEACMKAEESSETERVHASLPMQTAVNKRVLKAE
jgi:hypothetical protein